MNAFTKWWLSVPCYHFKVDMTKVNLEVIKPWITQRVTEILGFEDDVVIEFIFNQLEEKVTFKVFFFSKLSYIWGQCLDSRKGYKQIMHLLVKLT